jgi:hypothetical protein
MAKNPLVTVQELLDRSQTARFDPETEALYAQSYGRFKLYPIDAGSRLYLDALGHGDDARFAEIFRRVWESIPTGDRIVMIRHWQTWERIPGVLGVRIRLENLSSMLWRRMSGVCEGPGTALVFYAPVVDRLPKHHAAALIAHELAHMFQASTGTLTVPDAPEWLTDELAQSFAADFGCSVDEVRAKFTYIHDPNERDADKITKRWGYNAPAMSRWISRKICWEELPPPIY